MKPIIVGTRGSKLALTQTNHVIEQLLNKHHDTKLEVRVIRTDGDLKPEVPTANLGLGIFVKEIEEALLNGDIDMAVHSLKDLPSTLPNGLSLGAFCRRGDPRDAFISSSNLSLARLSAGSRIGTSSPRRSSLLLSQRPDIEIKPLRGNVESRLMKIKGPDYDGTVLAVAGLQRLGLGDVITEYLPPERFVPAPGQGAIVIETRKDNHDLYGLLRSIDDPATRCSVTAERNFLEKLGSGCQIPAGAYAHINDNILIMHAMLCSLDGQSMFSTKWSGPASKPREVAMKTFERLVEMGALDVIEDIEIS
ncbi:hydroxymethylbilane synthase [SAR202 cluster bacterium AD-804-J14_MRT_500m]|nr:hydroxymethylbilane synthase [SAR202 cluster bacterium AD-804-J14_MRT_500m]